MCKRIFIVNFQDTLIEIACLKCVFYFDVSHSMNKSMSQALVQLSLFDADCFGQALSAQPTRIDVLYTGPAKYHVSTRHATAFFSLFLHFMHLSSISMSKTRLSSSWQLEKLQLFFHLLQKSITDLGVFNAYAFCIFHVRVKQHHCF